MCDGALSSRPARVRRIRRHAPFIESWLTLVWLSLLPLTGHAQDRVRPTLVSSTPPNNATGVDPSTSLRFVFSEPMKPQQQILWITSPETITSSAVIYAWSTDGRELTATLPGGWPASQRVSWIFQASLPAIPGISEGVPSFQDLAGNPVSGGVGSFTTSAGGPPPLFLTTNSCGVITTHPTRTTLSLAVSARYAQTNDAGLPFPNRESGLKPFAAVASVAPGIGSATLVVLDAPAVPGLTLTNRAGLFSRTDTFDSLDALTAAYPAGTYRFIATGTVGDVPNQAEVNRPVSEWPVLKVANHDFLQGVQGTNAVPIVWDPIGGTAQDVIRIVVRPISSPATTRWSSPDPGCPGAIHGTNTVAEIPFHALSGGTLYWVDLMLERTIEAPDPDGTTARRFFSLTTTTRVRLVLCSTGAPSRERDPSGTPDRCDETAGGGDNPLALRFLTPFVLETDQIRCLVSPTEIGVSYQLFEVLMAPQPTNSTPGRRPRGDPVSTPVGPPIVAAGTNTEFLLPLDPTTRSRVFGVGRSGGRR
jgi:hypothetical protein